MSLFEKTGGNRLLYGVIGIALLGVIYSFVSKDGSEEMLLPNYDQLEADEGDRDAHLPSAHDETPPPKKIKVDVKGEVLHPGVYEVEDGLRVIDVLALAGGTLQEADLMKINLAAFLKDGQVVYIPKIGEEESPWEISDETAAFGQGKESNQININTATLEELVTLPGIGPSKAQAIISYREEHGAFKDVEELTQVSGIGEKTLEKLIPLVKVK
jgi:competence protein ComEA